MGKRSSISSNSSNNDTQKKKAKSSAGSSSSTNKKRKLPTSFLDCQSLSLVVNNPHEQRSTEQENFCITPVVSESTKEIFLDRFIKEIVKPYQTNIQKERKETRKEWSVVLTTTTQQQQQWLCRMVD